VAEKSALDPLVFEWHVAWPDHREGRPHLIRVALPTLPSEVGRVEVGYMIATALLALMLFGLYRRPPKARAVPVTAPGPATAPGRVPPVT
jgi:hypothetical protein